MSFLKSKKSLVAVVALVVVAAAAVGAYAYFSATGSGTGSSATPTTINGWSVTGYTDPGTLWPGTADTLTTAVVTNPNSNSGPLHLNSVTVSVTGINIIGGGRTCDTSQFVFVDPIPGTWTITGSGTTAQAVLNSPAQYVNPNQNASLPQLQLELKDNGADQSGCVHTSVSLKTAVA
jgi:hypothetical protein